MINRFISTTVSIGILLTVFLIPITASAQSAGGAAAGTAACAVGGQIASAITDAISGIFSDTVSDTTNNYAGSKVPTIATDTDKKLTEGNAKAEAQKQKSFVLDRLASCAAKQLLHQMTADTINWINSGFNGGPAFLKNPQAFLLNTADQLTGEMISNSGLLQSLCSPWNVDIRLALALEQAGGQFNSRKYTCTLDKIITNARGTRVNVSLDGFMQGDFSQGGWDAFVDLTAGSQNPAMQYLMAKSDLQAALNEKTAAINKDLDRGFGFLSDTTCETVNLQSTDDLYTAGVGENQYITPNPDGHTGQRCTTKTPGSVIAHALNVHTDSGVVETEMANDINSVVSALITQLTSQMLTRGLSALSGNHSGVSVGGTNNLRSYISQLQADARAPQTVASGGNIYTVQNGGVNVTASPLVALYDSAINSVTNARTTYENTRNCYAEKLQSAPNNTGQVASVQPSIDAISSLLNGAIATLLNTLNTQRAAAATKATITSADTAQAQQASNSALTQAATWNTNANAELYTCQNSGTTNQ